MDVYRLAFVALLTISIGLWTASGWAALVEHRRSLHLSGYAMMATTLTVVAAYILLWRWAL